MILSVVAAVALLGALNYFQARVALKESLRKENMAWSLYRYGLHERPAHSVTLSRPFYLSTYEVTQKLWNECMTFNPSQHVHVDYPADSMTWEQANEYCRQLSRLLNQHCRLPTEAEWEYACRAGTTTAYSFGDDVRQLPNYAWLPENSMRKPMPVGLKAPNPWGLYDMHGNAWEWCQDWFGEYAESPQTDPQGPSGGPVRIIRGGSWMNDLHLSRSSARWTYYWGRDESDDVGVRVLLEVSQDRE